MAMTQQERDEKAAVKRRAKGELAIRLRVRPGTKRCLEDLMRWYGFDEEGEAVTILIHRLHEMGPDAGSKLLEVPRHEIDVTPSVALKLDQAYARESLRICAE